MRVICSNQMFVKNNVFDNNAKEAFIKWVQSL